MGTCNVIQGLMSMKISNNITNKSSITHQTIIHAYETTSNISQHHTSHMISNVGIYLTIRYKYLFYLSIQLKVSSTIYLKRFDLK